MPSDNRSTRSARIHAVAIVISHDQAGDDGPGRLLDEAVEWPAQLHQASPFVLFELRVFGTLGIGDALVFQLGEPLPARLHQRTNPRPRIPDTIKKIATM